MTRYLLIAVMLLCGCANRDTLVQYSTISALLAGVYDGDMTYGELRRHGDFGIGTFNELDGEMVALDGRYYQVTADGAVKPVRDDMRTPFAVVTRFKPTTSLILSNITSFSQLEQVLNGVLPVSNAFYAVQLTGTFRFVKARSVPRQHEPYPPLVEASKNQSIFEFHDVTGTLVGFRMPEFVGGLNVPGYHFHMLAADHRTGGHVLECQFDRAVARVDRMHNFLMILPKQCPFAGTDLSKPRGAELESVEKGH